MNVVPTPSWLATEMVPSFRSTMVFTMDNPRPPHHKSAGDTFDCRNVPLPFGEITKADFDYPGATISVTVAPDGRVIRYYQILKIDGVGEGAAMGLTASGKILGQVDEIWDITY